MTNYVELIKQLEKQDERIISKLSIYYELSAYTDLAELPAEDIDEVVEYVHNIYLSNDDMDYLYPKVAEAALEVCDYDLQQLLTSIRENGDELEEQILEELF